MGESIEAFNRMLDDGEEPAAALEFLKNAMKRTKQADGGRIELGIGGAASGIMQAIKLAAKGIKPFGQKQTYKQKVKMVGLQELQKGMKKEFDMELYKINKGRAGNPEAELFDLYEDVMSGKRYSMLPDKTRQEMMDQIEDSMRNYNVDGGDFQNFMGYMADEYGVSRDVQNNPFKFLDDIKKGIDKGQIKTMKADDLLDALDRESGANVIPFKPRDKKFKGGLMGLLKRVNPILEKEMVKPKIPVGPQRTDAIGDMEQIKNVSRSGDTGLEGFARMEDMIQESPRYNETMKAMFMKLIDYEKFRANLLDDNAKLQKMMRKDPEGTEAFLKLLFREEGSVSGFQMGGLIPPQKGPMSEGMGTLYRSK